MRYTIILFVLLFCVNCSSNQTSSRNILKNDTIEVENFDAKWILTKVEFFNNKFAKDTTIYSNMCFLQSDTQGFKLQWVPEIIGSKYNQKWNEKIQYSDKCKKVLKDKKRLIFENTDTCFFLNSLLLLPIHEIGKRIENLKDKNQIIRFYFSKIENSEKNTEINADSLLSILTQTEWEISNSINYSLGKSNNVTVKKISPNFNIPGWSISNKDAHSLINYYYQIDGAIYLLLIDSNRLLWGERATVVRFDRFQNQNNELVFQRFLDTDSSDIEIIFKRVK